MITLDWAMISRVCYQKARQQKSTICKLVFMKNFLHGKGKKQQMKGSLQKGRKYLHIIYMLRGYHPKHVRSHYNSTAEKKQIS